MKTNPTFTGWELEQIAVAVRSTYIDGPLVDKLNTLVQKLNLLRAIVYAHDVVACEVDMDPDSKHLAANDAGWDYRDILFCEAKRLGAELGINDPWGAEEIHEG